MLCLLLLGALIAEARAARKWAYSRAKTKT